MGRIKNYKGLNYYYDNENRYGEYQYSSIKDVVNNFMFAQGNDSYLSNVNRNRVSYFAKRVVQELYFDILNEVISIELDLNDRFTIPLPHDYVNYVMISWVDERGMKHPLAVDNTSNLAQSFLQDDSYEYLFDHEGDILQGDHSQDYGGRVSHFPSEIPDYNVDLSKKFKNGTYKVDRDRGIIQFSSSVQGRTIVLDYISDGLFQMDDSEIRIHKFAEEAAYSYIYWHLISNMRNVPANEKYRARNEWYNMRRVAKRRINPVRYEEIRQVMKSQSRMIKD